MDCCICMTKIRNMCNLECNHHFVINVSKTGQY